MAAGTDHVSGYEGILTISAAPGVEIDIHNVSYTLTQRQRSWEVTVKQRVYGEVQLGAIFIDAQVEFALPKGITMADLQLLAYNHATPLVTFTFSTQTLGLTTPASIAVKGRLTELSVESPMDGPAMVRGTFKQSVAHTTNDVPVFTTGS